MTAERGQDRQHMLKQAVECFSREDWRGGERWARQAVAANNEDSEALYALAQAIYQQGRLEEAVAVGEKLLAISPFEAVFHNDYGVMLAALGRWAEAETAHRIAVALDAANWDARFNLAVTLLRQQRYDEALAELDGLVAANPNFAEAYALRGEILQAAKRHGEAAAAYSQAIALGLHRADVFVNMGTALSDAGDKDGVSALLANMGTLEPQDAATHYYLGNLYKAQGRTDAAALSFRKAVELRPDFAEANNNLGLVLLDQGDTEGAEAAYARALSVAPEMGAVHNNLGNIRLKQGQLELALACFRKAVELSPDAAEVWNNYGEACYRMRRLDEAESAYRHALALNPESAEASLNLGILLLLRGDFRQGWPYYEKRWEMPAIRERRPHFAQPEWAGEPLDGKTLLVYVEQGMGDNLQFVRYLKVLRERYPTARIYYWCLRPLERLFAGFAARYGIELLPEVIPGGVPPIDYQAALLTIPLRLGARLETIPAEVPYLTPPDDAVARWSARLNALPGKKVGVVWVSGETYVFHKSRTMALSQLKPLLDVEGISWVSLQKGPGAAQIAEGGLSSRITDWMDEVEDFADTAALIAGLDLVISVDTSVPHLVGAMGKPVWLLDRYDTDWRWLLDRTDSPWYPSMRIFRQTAFGDWSSVVSPAAGALRRWVASGADAASCA